MLKVECKFDNFVVKYSILRVKYILKENYFVAIIIFDNFAGDNC